MSPIQGRTSDSYEDFFASDPQPRIWSTQDSVTGAQHYHLLLPCGHRGELSALHKVETNKDGTFTIRPHPDNSNSIQCNVDGCWHGYIYNNVWTSV